LIFPSETVSVVEIFSMGVSRLRPVTLGLAGKDPNTGIRQARDWLGDRKLESETQKRWHVEVSLATLDAPAPVNYDDRVDSRFHIDIYSEEWGFFFCHGGRASWIRITDIPFVHGRDDFHLLAQTPALSDVGALLRTLEATHNLAFRRSHALVRTNIAGAMPKIRSWVEAL
jgi:hypothetical protein